MDNIKQYTWDVINSLDELSVNGFFCFYVDQQIWSYAFISHVLQKELGYAAKEDIPHKKYIQLIQQVYNKELSYMELPTHDGKTIYYQIKAKDIYLDKRKAIFITFIESQELNRKRTDTVPCGLLCIEVNETIQLIYANLYCFQLYGYQKKKPLESILIKSLIIPEDYQKTITTIQQNMKSHATMFEIEYRARHQDGHLMYILMRFIPDTQKNCLLGVIFDITDRKEMTEQLVKKLKK